MCSWSSVDSIMLLSVTDQLVLSHMSRPNDMKALGTQEYKKKNGTLNAEWLSEYLFITALKWRGIGQYFDIFFLVELHSSRKIQLLIYKYIKKNSKIPSENEEIINFFFLKTCIKCSCCCLKHGYFKSKCHNLHNFYSILVSVQRAAQTSFRIFLQTIIKVDGAKFSSHDSGNHL